jgi:hypothetical protein
LLRVLRVRHKTMWCIVIEAVVTLAGVLLLLLLAPSLVAGMTIRDARTISIVVTSIVTSVVTSVVISIVISVTVSIANSR